jgi:hypothetical protein
MTGKSARSSRSSRSGNASHRAGLEAIAGRLLGNSAHARRCKVKMRDPALAAVLSAIIPGVGQFYKGRILAGILWLVITPGLWIGTGGLLGWTAHVKSAYTAYTYARDHRER